MGGIFHCHHLYPAGSLLLSGTDPFWRDHPEAYHEAEHLRGCDPLRCRHDHLWFRYPALDVVCILWHRSRCGRRIYLSPDDGLLC